MSAAAALKASQIMQISRASTSSTAATCSAQSIVGRVAAKDGLKAKLRQRSKIKHRIPPVYVKLAEEQTPAVQSESDSSAYDSFNEAETGK